MAIPLYGGLNVSGDSYGAGPHAGFGGPGAGWSGDPGYPWYSHRPPAARNVSARVTGQGADAALRVQWNDYSTTDHWNINDDFAWHITYTPVTAHGVSDIDLIFQKSRLLGTYSAVPDGGQRVFTYAEPFMHTGWIQVTGVSPHMSGPPSAPILLNLTGTESDIPDPAIVLGDTVGIFRETIPYDVIRFDFRYYLSEPAISSNFAGVHMHFTGYNTSTTALEFGSMEPWDGSTGFTYFTRRLAVDETLGGVASGAATFTNGSTAVVRTAGDVFSVGIVGRMITANVDGSAAYFVDTRTDNNNIDLLTPWDGDTGSYLWLVINQMTFYFVPIGPTGRRVGDITLCHNETV